MSKEFDGNGTPPTHLLFFYGDTCHFCHDLMPFIERVEEEEGVEVTRIETWNNSKNDKLKEEYDKDFCGGVPFCYNTKTKKWLCGFVEYDKFKAWATGE